jgi:hypothetical protein
MVADSRLRRDVMSGGGVAPVFSPGTATVTSTHLGGLEEKFAFARALSRLHEMSRMSGLNTLPAAYQTGGQNPGSAPSSIPPKRARLE